MVSNGWIIELIEYTDPYCTWCWASEPILRKIKEHFGEQVKILFKMGGLVDDVKTFYDPSNAIGGSNMFEQVAIHWDDASSRHGMPVDSRGFSDLKDSFTSTHPANIAYKAAQIQNQDLADKFLRRMREAAAAERKQIHKVETQIELAKEIGLNTDKFLESIESGIAKEAFLKELNVGRKLGITGFPTFAISNRKGKSIRLHGFQQYKRFEQAFESLLEKKMRKQQVPLNNENILKFIEKYRKVATQEVATLFEIKKEEAFKFLSKLKQEEKIVSRQAGNDFFWLMN
ncbi:hypothetical protein LCGC14_0412900 [marine sediment metagenome]|uniref:DSBA-like thioredoxin domain-containing protein n=1 Tax=marine sediment metagenome TaxID=412755 RepID=A0A0F9VF79_9ZZZZ|nr:DsbA family protein [archaeon]